MAAKANKSTNMRILPYQDDDVDDMSASTKRMRNPLADED